MVLLSNRRWRTSQRGAVLNLKRTLYKLLSYVGLPRVQTSLAADGGELGVRLEIKVTVRVGVEVWVGFE